MARGGGRRRGLRRRRRRRRPAGRNDARGDPEQARRDQGGAGRQPGRAPEVLLDGDDAVRDERGGPLHEAVRLPLRTRRKGRARAPRATAGAAPRRPAPPADAGESQGRRRGVHGAGADRHRPLRASGRPEDGTGIPGRQRVRGSSGPGRGRPRLPELRQAQRFDDSGLPDGDQEARGAQGRDSTWTTRPSPSRSTSSSRRCPTGRTIRRRSCWTRRPSRFGSRRRTRTTRSSRRNGGGRGESRRWKRPRRRPAVPGARGSSRRSCRP